MDFASTKVLVMGLGLHGGGVGAANYFLSKGASVTITDLKSEGELEPSILKLRERSRVRLVLGRHEYEDFRNADLVVRNPAVPPDSPFIRYALEHGVKVDTDVGVFIDGVRGKTRNVIGVTGTKGKSTTATLVHRIFSRWLKGAILGGNIAVSVLDLLDGIEKGALVVLELSSFQLGGIRDKGYSPRVGVFTNFLEDHLNYYRSMAEYFEDKSVIYRFQEAGDALVLNRDDPALAGIAPRPGVRLVTFGRGADFNGTGSFLDSGRVCVRDEKGEHAVMETREIKIPGEHNLDNALAATAAAWGEGVPAAVIAEAIRSYSGMAHRLEFLGARRGVSFYNDTAATMPDATILGIGCFSDPITLIAGGADKGLGLERLVEAINGRVRTLVLLEGTGTERLLGGGIEVPHEVFGNLKDAFAFACSVTPEPGTVLLSPGFASFGMFRNEFDRGNQFKDLVRELLERG